MNIVKKALAVILLLTAMFTFCACENNTSTEHQTEQKSLPTAENIINAFAAAGYVYEMVDDTTDEGLAEEGVISYTNYQLMRERSFSGISEQISDYCELRIYQLSDENHAKQLYNMMLYYLNDEGGNQVGTFVQTDIQNGKKAVSKVPFGEGHYGASSILSQQNETVVLLYMDWDDYQDVHMEYDYLPEEILNGFGY